MSYTRRTLIIGVGLATATPKIVKATSLLDMPSGLRTARRWAVNEFTENPGCRLVFSDGSAHRWFSYDRLWWKHHAEGSPKVYAIAMEVCVTDAEGRRVINTIPVDGRALTAMKEDRKSAGRMKSLNGWTPKVDF